jgi:hypothetical protein
VQKSTPFYKKELLLELKIRLGRQAIPKVAESCSYSDRYVRNWFKSFKHNDVIKDAAINLLADLKKQENASLTALSE